MKPCARPTSASNTEDLFQFDASATAADWLTEYEDTICHVTTTCPYVKSKEDANMAPPTTSTEQQASDEADTVRTVLSTLPTTIETAPEDESVSMKPPHWEAMCDDNASASSSLIESVREHPEEEHRGLRRTLSHSPARMNLLSDVPAKDAVSFHKALVPPSVQRHGKQERITMPQKKTDVSTKDHQHDGHATAASAATEKISVERDLPPAPAAVESPVRRAVAALEKASMKPSKRFMTETAEQFRAWPTSALRASVPMKATRSCSSITDQPHHAPKSAAKSDGAAAAAAVAAVSPPRPPALEITTSAGAVAAAAFLKSAKLMLQ